MARFNMRAWYEKLTGRPYPASTQNPLNASNILHKAERNMDARVRRERARTARQMSELLGEGKATPGWPIPPGPEFRIDFGGGATGQIESFGDEIAQLRSLPSRSLLTAHRQALSEPGFAGTDYDRAFRREIARRGLKPDISDELHRLHEGISGEVAGLNVPPPNVAERAAARLTGAELMGDAGEIASRTSYAGGPEIDPRAIDAIMLELKSRGLKPPGPLGPLPPGILPAATGTGLHFLDAMRQGLGLPSPQEFSAEADTGRMLGASGPGAAIFAAGSSLAKMLPEAGSGEDMLRALFDALTHPRETASTIAEGIKSDPVGSAGFTTGMLLPGLTKFGRNPAAAIEKASDSALIRLAKSGNQQAHAAIYNRYYNQLYRHAFRMLDDPTVAADVAEATLANALTNIDQFQSRSKLSTWLYRNNRNEVYSYWRSKRSAGKKLSLDQPVGEGEVLMDAPDLVAAPETGGLAGSLVSRERPPIEGVMKQDLDAAIAHAKAALSDLDRQAFEMVIEQDMPNVEAAKRLGISQAAVGMRLRRARTKLRSLLKDFGPE